MITGKRKVPRVFHQTDIGAGKEAWAIAQRARDNPDKHYLATDFKFVNEKAYLEKWSKHGVQPFPKNLHFLSGGALTAINRMHKLGKRTDQFVIAMGVKQLLSPTYLGKVAKHAKKVLNSGGSIYFVSTWPPEVFESEVVPRFKKEGYSYKKLKPSPKRQAAHSGKALDYQLEFGQVQWEYKFTLK